jgi:antirestriction protein ArdC
VPDGALIDRHVSDLVVGPEEALALIQPHLPCSCSSCTASTLMVAAGYALGRRYTPTNIGRMWSKVVEGGYKIALLMAARRAAELSGPCPRSGDHEATKRRPLSLEEARRARGAH